MSTMSYEALSDEVLSVLAAADGPLNIRELEARCDLADGIASLAEPLHRLRQEGEVAVVEAEDGKARRYQVADGTEPEPQAKQPAGAKSATPQTELVGNSHTGLSAAVVETLRQHGSWMNTRDLREAVGGGNVSGALSYLRRKGVVEFRGRKGSLGYYRLIESPEGVAPAGPCLTGATPNRYRCKPDETASSEAAKPEADPVSPMSAGPASERPTEREAKPTRYAYRSDGTLLIEQPGRDPLELDREDAERLYRYLTGINLGVHAALARDYAADSICLLGDLIGGDA